jgi:biotin synthase
VTPTKALKALALFRFTNPASDIRAAGGRERNLGDWQALVLYPANSVFIEGYLTTTGLAAGPTHRMIEALGFTIEAEEATAADHS